MINEFVIILQSLGVFCAAVKRHSFDECPVSPLGQTVSKEELCKQLLNA
jgi:hypothetical protein